MRTRASVKSVRQKIATAVKRWLTWSACLGIAVVITYALRLFLSPDPTIVNYGGFFLLFLAPFIFVAILVAGILLGLTSAAVPEGLWSVNYRFALVALAVIGIVLALLAPGVPTHPAVP